MENQHQKIKGYRDLSQEEIDLMNDVKELGAKLIEKQAELVKMLTQQGRDKAADAAENTCEHAELERFYAAEPLRWAAIGKTDIQTGIMALVRAIAQPGGGV